MIGVARVASGLEGRPCDGRLEQVASRPAGFMPVVVKALLDCEPIPVRIMGTCRAISTAIPRELRIQQGGAGHDKSSAIVRLCDTSTPGVRIGGTGEYRVSELDQKKMAPTTFSKSRGRAEGLCGRSPTALPSTRTERIPGDRHASGYPYPAPVTQHPAVVPAARERPLALRRGVCAAHSRLPLG